MDNTNTNNTPEFIEEEEKVSVPTGQESFPGLDDSTASFEQIHTSAPTTYTTEVIEEPIVTNAQPITENYTPVETVATMTEEPKTEPKVEAPKVPFIMPKGMKYAGIAAAVLVVGFIGTGVIRQYIGSLSISDKQTGNSDESQTIVNEEVTPTPSIIASISNFSSWKAYDVISGFSKKAVAGLSYKLPKEVLTPICDGSACASQGTYLPGGSRLTIAPRGKGQVLPDFRGKTITDASGVEFTTKQTTVGGRNAMEFTGTRGSTSGGYGFTQIKGYMIEATPDVSLEISIFAPAGLSTKFDSDAKVFEDILKTFAFVGTTSLQDKGGISSPTATVQTTPSIVCSNLYWIDNENKGCGTKSFCGAYMYYGLQTFKTKEECLKVVVTPTKSATSSSTTK